MLCEKKLMLSAIWHEVLKITSKHGNANYYALNGNSG